MQTLLLADPSPCLRRLVLRDVPDADETELAELDDLVERDPLVAGLTVLQHENGAWRAGDGAWRAVWDPVRMTSLALFRLGFLGFDASFGPVRRGAEFIFSLQRDDGSWDVSDQADGEAVDRAPLQVALPLRGLAACGYAQDPRAERSFAWIDSERLEDGAWPTGYARGNLRKVAGYRKMAHSEWGCRSNTTGVLQCLTLHPERAQSPAARRALDLLFGRETREAHVFGFETARLLGAEPATGMLTFFARFDVALMLDLAGRVGADRTDPRIADAVAFAESLRGEFGLWRYAPRPECSRWITFDVPRSLARLERLADDGGRNWVSAEPRTPFAPCRQKPARF